MQVPEYAHPRQPPYLHPFSQPLLIRLPLKKKQYMRLNLLIQDALLTRFDFVIESDVVTRRGNTNIGFLVDAPVGIVNNASTLQLEVHRLHQLTRMSPPSDRLAFSASSVTHTHTLHNVHQHFSQQS